jgi:hypothetical protein
MKLNFCLTLAMILAIGQIGFAQNRSMPSYSNNYRYGLLAENSNSPNDSETPDSLNINKSSMPVKLSTGAPNESSGVKLKKPWPTGALLRSAVLPGWGQVYNRQYIKAILYGGTEITLAVTTAHYWKQMSAHQRNFLNSTNRTYQAQEFFYYQNSQDNRNLFMWLTGITFFISIFDAYVDAHFADFNQQDKAFQAHLLPNKDALYLSLTYNLK